MLIFLNCSFWLPQGAQGVTLSVRLFGTKLSKALNIHLRAVWVSLGQSQVSLRSVSGQTQVSLRSDSGQSQVRLRSLCAYLVKQTEPKILRLVRKHQLYIILNQRQ